MGWWVVLGQNPFTSSCSLACFNLAEDVLDIHIDFFCLYSDALSLVLALASLFFGFGSEL